MAVIAPYFCQIGDESGIGEARRAAVTLAGAAGFNETEAGKLAIAVTEAAANVLKHAGGGEILLRTTENGIEMLAIDKGPGIADLQDALRDGRSSAGTAGIGLGAISRLAGSFDVYTGAGLGTALVAQFHRANYRPTPHLRAELEIGAAQAPYPGEEVSGDAWVSADYSIFVADGLGHGFHAAAAAQEAVKTFEEHRRRATGDVVGAIHLALRSTRGAAVAVAAIDPDRHAVRFCGIGNISGVIVAAGLRRGMMSHNGTAGHEASRIVPLEYPLPEGALLVMHSDGISAKWDLSSYPGLASRHASLVAAVLYRDFRRRTDDATVVVARVCPPSGRESTV
jgi:anti-sigma regulatory factor (Ser/Thr protein kinase)